MLFAIVGDKKLEAEPGTTGICPLCNRTLIAKCGEIKVWHWAHQKEEGCDSWYEPETEWHKNWKFVFGKDNCEIVITANKVKHIADIRTKEEVVIELQNSRIQKDVIRKRETFYGKQMLWVINGKPFKEHFTYRLSPLKADAEYYRLHNPLLKQGDVIDRKIDTKELDFKWKWCWQSWDEVRRPVFIDFGGDTLFRVTKGMGTDSGNGREISKEAFVRKYGGNLGLLAMLIDDLDE